MNDYFDEIRSSSANSFWSGLDPAIKAALIFSIPFIITDFFNYYSAGTALVISCPLLFVFYLGCGALAGKFSSGEFSSPNLSVGAKAGAFLWLTSTLVNTVISLILGTASLGMTLLLGIPYLCLCAPFHAIFGALVGSLGCWVYIAFRRRSSSSYEDNWNG